MDVDVDCDFDFDYDANAEKKDRGSHGTGCKTSGMWEYSRSKSQT